MVSPLNQQNAYSRKNIRKLGVYVGNQLIDGKDPSIIISEMVKQGWNREDASAFVLEMYQVHLNNQLEKNYKRMGNELRSRRRILTGGIWFLFSLFVVVITYFFPLTAAIHIFFWIQAAIGLIIIIVGVIGWLIYKE